MVDYLIDGIPSHNLQDMARIKEFKTKEDMLMTFEKMSLRQTARNTPKRDSRLAARQETIPAENEGKKDEKRTKNDEEKPKSICCYNCNKLGHLAADCHLPKGYARRARVSNVARWATSPKIAKPRQHRSPQRRLLSWKNQRIKSAPSQAFQERTKKRSLETLIIR